MNWNLDKLFNDLDSKDNELRLDALNQLLKITEDTVDWFEDRYLEIVEKLKSENSYQRSIAILLLCNLAKSDKKLKMDDLLKDILNHTHDEKLITSRQCIQNIWKIAIVNEKYELIIFNHLKKQFINCKDDKHFNLIRQDIIQSLYNIYKTNLNKQLKKDIFNLISLEEDEKYKNHYLKIIK